MAQHSDTASAHRHGFVSHLAILCLALPIQLYRLALSPLLPPSCRFAPSCSAYALEALTVHGPLKGIILALKRLARCHPIPWLGGGSGFDPVPKP
jgi:putative membrane protein insertion efficiency factor